MTRKTSTPKNSITDAPASFREELRLLKERIVHLETIVDKIDELEEKIEELIKREPAVLDPNLEPSLSATGRPVEGAKDVVPLMILQDAFSQQPRLKELMTTTPWSKLDSQSKEQLATSVEAALRFNKCKIPTNKRILQRIKASYSVARDKAVKEAISKGTVQSGDMESITKIRDSVKPIPLENLTIEVADHEDGASKMRRLESISKAREARWIKHNIKATGEGGNPVKSQDTIKDALMVVSDIQQKLELYRAHRVRVANQQKAIYKIEEEMKQECLANKISSKHALVVIDWKMKLSAAKSILGNELLKKWTYFSRLNDIFFLERIGPWISAALYNIEVVRQTAIAFKVRVFAYSGIGSGIAFDCKIQEQSFAPTQVDQESVLENEDGSDETEDNEDVVDDEEGGNELVDAAAQIELEADLQDLDVAPKTLPAVEQYMFYGPVNDKSKQMVTGVKVVKCSKLAGLKGPRTLCSQQTEKNMEDFTGVYVQQPPPRMDAVAIAVRCANDLIHSVLKVRSGKDDMVEYLLSQQLEIPQSSLKRQGWAWHPAHGDTYGTTYVHLYRTEIKEMFDRGVQTETKKMSPAIMLETLQERYPNRYSLPGENEIRTEISSLLQKQKSGRTQKKSKFSTTFTEFIKNIFDQVLEQKDHQLDRIKPKEILAIVKQHFMEEDGSIPLDFPSDKYITAKVSNLKSMAKKEGHRNIMLC
eukprot:Em0018g389a